jgi:branched-chain amino acid transport system ATP-binding protein
MHGKTIVESQRVSKRFGDFTAVDGVDYSIFEGEAAGIIGPNGAGKSTFFNLITGLYHPSEGVIRFSGRDVTRLSADQRVGMGMVRTFQLVSVFDSLPVMDNLVLAVVRASPDFVHKSRLMVGSAHPKHVRAACEEALTRVQLEQKAGFMTSELSYGDKRMLEIAMALALKPKLLLLDEPLAGLSDVEINQVLSLVRKVSEELTVVIIEHKISYLVGLVSRLSVMHEGRFIAEGRPQDVLCDLTVRRVYWGEHDPACDAPAASPE